MLVKIRKTGSSLALTIPKDIAVKLNLKPGDMVDVGEKSGDINFHKVEVFPSLTPEIEQIAEKGIQRFHHDLEILANNQ